MTTQKFKIKPNPPLIILEVLIRRAKMSTPTTISQRLLVTDMIVTQHSALTLPDCKS